MHLNIFLSFNSARSINKQINRKSESEREWSLKKRNRTKCKDENNLHMDYKTHTRLRIVKAYI